MAHLVQGSNHKHIFEGRGSYAGGVGQDTTDVGPAAQCYILRGEHILWEQKPAIEVHLKRGPD